VGNGVGVGGMTPPPAGGVLGSSVGGTAGAGKVAVGPGGGTVGTTPEGNVGDGNGAVGNVAVQVAVDVAVGVPVNVGVADPKFGSGVLMGEVWKSQVASAGVFDPAIARVVRMVTITRSASSTPSRVRRLPS